MERQASLDLLNATHSFPCEFTLKIIGLTSDDFVDRCIEAVRSAKPESDEIPFTIRSTPKGKHMSITLLPILSSAEQVLDIYDCLCQVEGVVMTM